MVYRVAEVAPISRLAPERRGAVVGRFCRVCQGVYPRYAARHHGKPMYGKDHVSSPCSHEGQAFVDGAQWWEPAVELRSDSDEVIEAQGDPSTDAS